MATQPTLLWQVNKNSFRLKRLAFSQNHLNFCLPNSSNKFKEACYYYSIYSLTYLSLNVHFLHLVPNVRHYTLTHKEHWQPASILLFHEWQNDRKPTIKSCRWGCSYQLKCEKGKMQTASSIGLYLYYQFVNSTSLSNDVFLALRWS